MSLDDDNYSYRSGYSFEIVPYMTSGLSVTQQVFEPNSYELKKQIIDNSNICKESCNIDTQCGGFIYRATPDRTCYFFNKNVKISKLPPNIGEISNFTIFKKIPENTIILDNNDKISTGMIIGITMGMLLIPLLIIFIVMLYKIKKNNI